MTELRARIRAVVPVKEIGGAKQRLAGVLSAALRQELALTMLEDVLDAASRAAGLAGILVVTCDPRAADIAARFGAEVSAAGARDGHSGAVAAAARLLAQDGAGMLTMPADIPLVLPEDIECVLSALRAPRGFVIVPAHDERGSNAILCAPADAVTLRFGDDSFFPHLAAARAAGLEPAVLRLPRFALDLDRPEDLAEFLGMPARTRSRALLARHGFSGESYKTPNRATA